MPIGEGRATAEVFAPSWRRHFKLWDCRCLADFGIYRYPIADTVHLLCACIPNGTCQTNKVGLPPTVTCNKCQEQIKSVGSYYVDLLVASTGRSTYRSRDIPTLQHVQGHSISLDSLSYTPYMYRTLQLIVRQHFDPHFL